MFSRAFAFLALIVLAGCGRTPPDEVSIDSAFSDGERATIEAALAAWCDEVGWCPEIVRRSERGHIALVDTLVSKSGGVECPAGLVCTVAGYNDGDTVYLARDRPDPEDMGEFWREAAHELGHFCTGHTRSGLMSEIIPADANAIDRAAADAWRDGCL